MQLNVRSGLIIMSGTGIFAGVIALLMLITGNWAAFFGALVVSLGFIGLGWAGKRMLLPDNNESPLHGISLMIGIIFGGAGLLMLIGSLALFVDGDFPAATAMLIFGLVFSAVAFFGSRAFAEPRGAKAVKIGGATKSIHSVLSQSGVSKESAYIYVDEKTTDAEIERRQKSWAEQPWIQREDWAQGKVVQEGTFDMRLLTVFTVIWNIIGWSIAGYGIWIEWDSPNIPWFLVVFPIFGVVLVIVTVRTWIRKRKFGISVLYCKTMPFRLGEKLQGTVQTGVPLENQTAKEFSVRLVCIKRSSLIDQDGDERVSEEKLWSQKQTVFGGISGTGPTFQVSVNVDIPADLPATELHPENDRTLWCLELNSPVKGVDYAARFEVPVYRN